MGFGLNQQIKLQEETLSTTNTTLFDASWSNTNESSFITYLENGIRTAFQMIISIALALAPTLR